MMSSGRCLACGSADLAPLRAYRSESPAGKRLFSGQLCRCEACSLVQLSPVPSDDELGRYYARDYRSGGRYGGNAADLANFPRDNLFFFNRGEAVADLLVKHLGDRSPSRILDVGAGFGHILHRLGERFPGAALHAHELSEPCVAHLRGIGVAVHDGALAEVVSKAGPFDIVVLSHVLEHLRDPVGVLRLLGGNLSAGGLLSVEVPHVPADTLLSWDDSPWAPRHDEPHLTFFGAPELRSLLERSGFDIRFLETAGPSWRRVSRLRYHLPPLMPTLRRAIPEGLQRALRRRSAGAVDPAATRWPAFHAYGGHRIWLRAIATFTGDAGARPR
ncbi:MAG: class I SAM-dependent methyltransferase [Gemmatimonadetes bacterium]|nr:class I SAM-dependent methyltransferase [Gemmatimonadota bacterium]